MCSPAASLPRLMPMETSLPSRGCAASTRRCERHVVVSTESGYQPGTGDTAGSSKETTQANTVRRAYEDFLSRPKTGFILIYTMMNDSVPGWGLLRDDRSRRPAFGVLQGIAPHGLSSS
jgi:hypothetical protein